MNRNSNALKQLAIVMAALTYAGAVVYGDIQFLQVVSISFPKGTILEGAAYFGAVVTALTALTLPVAIHWWFAPGIQFLGGILFWLVDIVALAMNSMLAYQIAAGTVDPVMHVWQMMAPATPIAAVLGWGILFMLDTSHRLRHAQAELEADQIDIYASRLRDAARADNVDAQLAAGAQSAARAYAHALTQGPAVQAAHVEPETRRAQLPLERLNAEPQAPEPAIVPVVARKNGHPNA